MRLSTCLRTGRRNEVRGNRSLACHECRPSRNTVVQPCCLICRLVEAKAILRLNHVDSNNPAACRTLMASTVSGHIVNANDASTPS